MKEKIKQMKEENINNTLKKHKEVQNERESELKRIQTSNEENLSNKQKFYKIYFQEKNKNKELIKKQDNKLTEKKKKIAQKVKDEISFSFNKINNNKNNKYIINEKEQNDLENVKLEIEKLKNYYDELTKQENEYMKKLRETKKLNYLFDNSISNTELNSFNNRNKLIKKKSNVSHSKIIRNISNTQNNSTSNNLTKSENNIDFINININVNTNLSHNQINEMTITKKLNRSKSGNYKNIALKKLKNN